MCDFVIFFSFGVKLTDSNLARSLFSLYES